MTDLCPHMLPPENCVYCRRPDAPPPKSAETMSPERRLRAGIKLAHHHALWLGVVGYRNDPLDQKLVDHVLAQVRQRVDDYLAATKELLVPPPESAEPASGKVIERLPKEFEDAIFDDLEQLYDPPTPPSDKVLVSREAHRAIAALMNCIEWDGDIPQIRYQGAAFRNALAALRSELEDGADGN